MGLLSRLNRSSLDELKPCTIGDWLPSRALIIGAGQMGCGIALNLADSFSRHQPNRQLKVSLLDILPQSSMKQKKQDVSDGLRRWYPKSDWDSRREELQQLVQEIEFLTMPPELLAMSSYALEGIPIEGQSTLDDIWIERIYNTDLMIEAITENEQSKSQIFNIVSRIGTTAQVIATNTSSISITKLSQSISPKLRDRFIGMHFMNPVPRMSLVEIIKGLSTSEQTAEMTKSIAQLMDKKVGMSRDFPGFISNRILMIYINEAIIAYQEGIGTKEDIDTIMKVGTNVPMGPLQLADFIGLDTCLSILTIINEGIGGSRFHPASLLKQYVDAGRLGYKTGKGFYDYTN